jgi:hypothetical protein
VYPYASDSATRSASSRVRASIVGFEGRNRFKSSVLAGGNGAGGALEPFDLPSEAVASK